MPIEVSRDRVVIRDFDVDDPGVVAEFRSAQDAGRDPIELCKRILALGAQVVALGSHTASVEKLDASIGSAKVAIQGAVNEVSTTLKKQLSELVSEDGSLVRNVNQVVEDLRQSLEVLTTGEDSPLRQAMLKSLDDAQSRIQKDISLQVGQQRSELADLLDTEKATSPLRALSLKLDALSSSVDELRQERSREIAVANVVEAGVIGGLQYEDVAISYVQRLANLAGDECERTGNVTGWVSKSKKGDGVVHLMVGGLDKARIVIEAKNQSLSRHDWEREAKGAKENRAAGSFLGLCKHVEDMPTAGRLMVLSPNEIVIAFNPEIDDVELLALTYQLLKLNAVRGFGSLDEVSVEEVNGALVEALTALERFDGISKQVSAIRNSADKIKQEADAIRESVRRSLRRAETAMRPDPPATELSGKETPLSGGGSSDPFEFDLPNMDDEDLGTNVEGIDPS